MIKKLALWETRHQKTVVIIAMLLVIPSLFGFLFTRVNYDIMSFLPDDLESVQGEQVLDETFGLAGMSMVVVEDMPAKYTAELKAEIEKIDGVKTVLWIDEFLDVSVPVSILPDVIKQILYSADESSTMMLVQYTDVGSSDKTLDAIKTMKTLICEKVVISGVSAMVEDTKELCEKQGPVFVAVAVLLVLIVLLFLMESWVLPFVVLASLGLAIIYNMGSNIFLGEISFITQSIAAILQLGVTMDYSIFLIDRYHEEKLIYDNRETAMANAVVKSMTALAGSSLTTIFGFLALCFMRLSLGFDIGFVMAKGVVLGIMTVVTILPVFVLITEKYIDKYKHKAFSPKFTKLNNFVFKRKAIIIAVCLILVVPAYMVQDSADLYYNMDKALPQDLVSVRGLYKLKDDFGMAASQFIVFDDSLPAGEVMQMEDEISALEGISSTLSYGTVLGPAVPSSIVPDELLSICKVNGLQLMMVNSIYATCTDELNEQVETIEKIVKSYDPNALVTGEGAISKDMVVTADRDFAVTGWLSVIAIFILIAICFKSLSIPIILLLSIKLATWINLSISVLLGRQMSFADPTVINCVQLGATVDYAILLTTRFREELANKIPRKESILNALAVAEKSILQSASVFFAATFGVYLVCDIAIIKGICSLLARGSIISAIVIVVFTAPVLYLAEPIISKTTLNWYGDKPRKKNKHKKTDEKEEAENNA